MVAGCRQVGRQPGVDENLPDDEADNLAVQGATFEGRTEPDGGRAADTFTDQGDNTFNGPLTLANFEVIQSAGP